MAERDIVILGSGLLARSICYSLAVVCRTRTVVTVVSRTSSSAAEVCYVANARAAVTGRPVRFQARSLPRYSAEFLAPLLRQARPAVVLSCASVQSPWERTRSPSAWTGLMATAGFGVTLPLQAAVAIEAASAVAAQDPAPLFLNASFPDAVNPLLTALGLQVFCGVGNVAILAASIREALRVAPRQRLQVLGHHWHLHSPDNEDDEALAWLDGTPVPGVGSLLERQRAVSRSELNFVNGHVTAFLLAGLVAGRDMRVNLPGPLGLAGGYPVRIRGHSIELDLPVDMWSRAFALNNAWAERDGVVVENSGQVTFSEHCVRAVRSELPDFAGSVRAADVPAVCEQLLELRSRMRLARSSVER